MKEVFVLKHAVGGRTFIHTGQQPMEYSVTASNNGWSIKVKTLPDTNVQEILKWKRELNMFLFQESEDQPEKKIWFYVKEGPVTYDDQSGYLTIHAASRIEYVPSKFSG